MQIVRRSHNDQHVYKKGNFKHFSYISYKTLNPLYNYFSYIIQFRIK